MKLSSPSSLSLNCSTKLDAACTAADLRSLAIQSLEANPTFRGWLALAGIHIESDGDKLILNGRLPSYYLKQLLEESVRRVEGVANVESHVVVVNPSGLLDKG